MAGFGTTASKVPGVYTKYFNRPLSLIGVHFWDAGERVGAPEICGGEIFFEPLLIYRPGKGVSVYYNESDPRQDPVLFVEYFNRHKLELRKLAESYIELFKELVSLMDEERTDFKETATMLRAAWPAFVLASILANECREHTEMELLEMMDVLRGESVRLLPAAHAYVFKLAHERLPEELKSHTHFVTLEEALSHVFPSEAELSLRRKGYVYFRGTLSPGDVAGFLMTHGIRLEEDSEENGGELLRGVSAWRGKARGKVKVVFESSQMGKVEAGDIMVTPMTTPEYLPAMRKAAAFVTDEGGITCHAAIVAREMKKPCIVGTKIATKVLLDGDLVEVDADRGIITRL